MKKRLFMQTAAALALIGSASLAQAQATAEQIREKVRQQDLTKDIDLTSDAVASCPSCGAHAYIKRDGCMFCTACGHQGECG